MFVYAIGTLIDCTRITWLQLDSFDLQKKREKDEMQKPDAAVYSHNDCWNRSDSCQYQLPGDLFAYFGTS